MRSNKFAFKHSVAGYFPQRIVDLASAVEGESENKLIVTITVTGFDGLKRQINKVTRALASVNGTVAEVRLDGSGPANIETPMLQMEAAVDERIRPYAQHPFVRQKAQDLTSRLGDDVCQQGK